MPTQTHVTCPGCGGRKLKYSKVCWLCDKARRREEGRLRRICPVCLGTKDENAKMCRECRRFSGRVGEVESGPIREAVRTAVDNGMSLSQIAVSAGWAREPTHGDTTTLLRRLGLAPLTGRSAGSYTRRMRYDTAVRIVRAIDRAPVEFGL